MSTTVREGIIYWDTSLQPKTGLTITYRDPDTGSVVYTLAEAAALGYYFADMETGSYDVYINGVRDDLRSPRTVIDRVDVDHFTDFNNPHHVTTDQIGAAPTASVIAVINTSSETTKIDPDQLQTIPPAKITGVAVIDSDPRLADNRVPESGSVVPNSIASGYELMEGGSQTKLDTIAVGAQPQPSGSQMITLIRAEDSTVLMTSPQYAAVAALVDGEEPTGTYALRHKGILITAIDCDTTIVTLVSGSVPPPVNIRIYDILPVKPDLAPADQIVKMAYTARRGVISNKLRVMFRWNWSTLRITGSGTSVTVDGYEGDNLVQNTTSPSWTANELQNYYIFIPSKGNYKILSHNGTSAGTTVFTIDGNIGTLAHNSTDNWKTKIHTNADSYSFQAVPVSDSAEQEDRIEEGQNYVSTSPVRSNTTLELDIGTKYRFKVQTVIAGGKQTSALETMPSGTYYHKPGLATQAYAQPFICAPAPLPGTNVALSLTPTDYGFRLAVSDPDGSWDEATDYEVVYNAQENADFSNPDHARTIFSGGTLEISTTTSTLYYVGLRPLIMGYVVSAAISGSVVSGGGGIAPQDEVLAVFDARVTTFQATISGSAASGYDAKFADSTLVSPIGGSAGSGAGTLYAGELVGKVAIDSSDKEFLITQHKYDGTSHHIKVDGIAGATAPPVTTIKISSSKRGRRLFRSQALPLTYKITRISAAINTVIGPNLPTDPIKIRIYSSDGTDTDAGFVSTTFSTSDERKSQDLSLEIPAGKDFVVDAYDPDISNSNYNGFTGTITVYGRKVTLRDLGSVIERQIQQLS